jgi:hypothetical protein
VESSVQHPQRQLQRVVRRVWVLARLLARLRSARPTPTSTDVSTRCAIPQKCTPTQVQSQQAQEETHEAIRGARLRWTTAKHVSVSSGRLATQLRRLA